MAVQADDQAQQTLMTLAARVSTLVAAFDRVAADADAMADAATQFQDILQVSALKGASACALEIIAVTVSSDAANAAQILTSGGGTLRQLHCFFVGARSGSVAAGDAKVMRSLPGRFRAGVCRELSHSDEQHPCDMQPICCCIAIKWL